MDDNVKPAETEVELDDPTIDDDYDLTDVGIVEEEEGIGEDIE